MGKVLLSDDQGECVGFGCQEITGGVRQGIYEYGAGEGWTNGTNHPPNKDSMTGDRCLQILMRIQIICMLYTHRNKLNMREIIEVARGGVHESEFQNQSC